MIIAIHQPNYLPYPGFFDKMRQSDLFVIYDDAQFNKGDFHHRNKIRIFQGWKWLTVPVEKKLIPINEISIRNELAIKDEIWQNNHYKLIVDNYEETPFFHIYKKELKEIYSRKYSRLIDLNMSLINFLKNAFDIDTKLVLSSELGLKSKSTQRLIDIVKALEGDVYLSGPMGRKYLDIALFNNEEIEVTFQHFKHPVYKQFYSGFIPNLSAIDALFNKGEL